MAEISKISGVAIADVAAVDAVLKANIASILGLTLPSGAAFLLDTYTGAAAAYSVRRLASATTVLLRVRRETAGGTGDDDEADVAYDTNNELSLDSAISNASAGVTATTLGQFLNVGTVGGTTYTNPDSLTVTASCFVDEWKDQSGNGNHLSQATQGSQPQIHDGTVDTDLITENGQPCIEFVSSDILNTGTFNGDPQLTQPTTWFWTINKASHSSYLFDDYGSIGRQAQGNGTWAFAGSVANNFFPSADLNQQRLFTLLFDGASSISRMNGSATGSGNPGTNGSRGIQINSSDLKVQEIVVYNADQTSNFTGIETNINSDYLIYQPTTTPTSGLLATYSGAAAAYSVRQLANTAVIAMTVRRDSDDEEKRFGFDANGDLDTAGIADFCDTANGYVSQWWDQSTNGNHASQGTAADQPKVYDASSGLLTENGKPYINFQSSQMTTGVLPSGTDSVFGVYKRVSSGSIMYLAHDNGWFYGVGFSGQTGTAFIGGSAFIDGSSFTGTRDDFWTAAASQILVTAIRDFSSADDYNMTYQNGNNWNNFMRQELIIYPDDQSSNRTGIETNIDDYYQIPGM